MHIFGQKNLKGGNHYLKEKKCDKTKFNIPKYEIEALARAFLPAVLNYYRSEEGKKEFEKEDKALTSKNKNP